MHPVQVLGDLPWSPGVNMHVLQGPWAKPFDQGRVEPIDQNKRDTLGLMHVLGLVCIVLRQR